MLNRFQFQVNVGTVALAWNPSGALARVDLFDHLHGATPESEIPPGWNSYVTRLLEYFAFGKPLDPLPLERIDHSAWTDFQREVYRAVSLIPHGETRTYGWVAHKMGRFAATRAVGQALRNNPVPIVIPCHRVTAVSSLGGFMGAVGPEEPEMKLKKRLIALEEGYLNPVFSFITAAEKTA